MRDLLLWRLLHSPTLDPAELTPLLESLAESSLRERTPFLGLLGPALTHADAGLRRAAVRVLSGATGRTGLQRNAASMGDADEEVRRAAVDSLRDSVSHDPLRWVHALFHPDEGVRRAAIDPTRTFPPPLSYKLYLLADPACRETVLAHLEARHLDGPSLPLLFHLVRQGVITPDMARRLGAAVGWGDWVVFLGDLLPRNTDISPHLTEAMQPAWLQDLFTHYIPDRLDELLLLFYDEDAPGVESSPHARFFAMLWSVVLDEGTFFRQWITFTLLGIAVQRGAWPALAARILAVCHPPFLTCVWVPEAVRRAALLALLDAREKCTRLPAAQIEPIAKSDLCYKDGALDLPAVTAALAALDGDPLAALLEWFGPDAVRVAFEADRERGVAILGLPTISSWQRTRFIRDFCARHGPDRHRELAALVAAVPADSLDFLDSLDGTAACHLLERLVDLEGEKRGFSVNKVRRLAARLAVPIAAGQVARFLRVWLARATPEASALCSAILTRLIHEHASRLVLPAVVGLELESLRRFLALLPFCPGYPYDAEVALAGRLDKHADTDIRAWAVARLRDHAAIVAARAKAEEEEALMPPATPVLRLGICAALAARPDPVAPDIDTCQALLASHDPQSDVVAQLARFVSSDPAFETALDVAMVEHWNGEPRLPMLGHAWLFRWEAHRAHLAGAMHERGVGTVLREAVDWHPAIARRVWDAGFAVLESWRWHDNDRMQHAWDGRLADAILHAVRTPLVDVVARICLHGVRFVRGNVDILTDLRGRLLPLMADLDEAGRALFREWIDTRGLGVSGHPEHAARTMSPAHARFRQGMALCDVLGEESFDELLAIACEPTDAPWLDNEEYAWLLAHCDDHRAMNLRLLRSPHPLAVMNAVQALSQVEDPDPLVRQGLLDALDGPMPLMREHRLMAARRLYEQGERLAVLPLLLPDVSGAETKYPALLTGVPAPVVSAVAAGVLMVRDAEWEGHLLTMLEHGRAFTGVWGIPDHRQGGIRADRVDLVGRADAMAQLLSGGSSTGVRQRARRALRSGMGRSHKLRRVAETFAWGVRIGRQLTGKLFTLEMIAGEALGYTRLRENKLYISPLPLLRGQQNGREVVRGLILHEYGHHLYHKGEGAEAIWEGAQAQGVGKLLNLVSDEHLERNLRVMDESFGNQLKQLGAFAFQHTAREVAVQTLLDALRGRAFDVLSRTHLGVARRDGCVLVNSGRALLEMERAGISFARFFRALRMGLGNRHDDPKVARGLALFDKDFRKTDMAGLMDVTRKLREIFGEETDLLESFEQDGACMGDADELSDACDGITNEELQGEIRRSLEGKVTTTRTPRPGGAGNAGRTYNLSPDEEFTTIQKIVPRAHIKARHALYAERVARPARQMRQFLQHLGLGVVPQRMRTQGKTFDRSRIRPLVLRGDPRVLIARETRTITDLFLGVLLDCSGSMMTDNNIEKAKLFATLLAEASRGLRGVTLRLWGFTDQTIYDCGDAARPAVHDLEPEDANNDSAAMWHASQVARASNRRAKVLVMISDGSPAGCSVASLKALVQRLTTRQKMLCAQVAVRPLDDVCFPHYVLLENDNLDECVRRFGAVVMRLVRQALKG
jgi:hypothetical protein